MDVQAPGGALERFRERRRDRERERQAGDGKAQEADVLFAQARDRFVEAEEANLARRAEGRRLLARGRFALARERREEAGAYLAEAARLLLASDVELAAARTGALGLARLRVTLLDASTATLRLYPVNAETLLTDEEPIERYRDVPLPFDAPDLEPGEYIVRIAGPWASQTLQFPVLLAPGDDWTSDIPIALDEIPEGFCYVPAGPFLLGSDHGSADETPLHWLDVPAFCIGRLEVTTREYAAFAEERAYRTLAERERRGWVMVYGQGVREQRDASFRDPSGRGGTGAIGGLSAGSSIADHPVTQVAFEDARAFVDARGLRLPSEVEWEKAARGIDGRRYPWGEAPPAGRETPAGAQRLFRANFATGDQGGADGYRETAPVGQFPDGASPYGVFDIAGNVVEWCSSGYQERTYEDADASPADFETSARVARGGAWSIYPSFLRASFRFGDVPQYRVTYFGFRAAVVASRARAR